MTDRRALLSSGSEPGGGGPDGLVAILERTLSGDPGRSLAGGVVRQTVQALGRAIVAGRYAEDGPLPTETELAAEYAVGRNALREAIKVLAGKGMIRTARRYGSRIRPRPDWSILDPDVLAWHLQEPDGIGRFLVDIAELREIIEPRAAELAALRATAEEAEEIVALAARLAVETMPQVLDTDVRFHLAVLNASHNRLLSGFARSLDVLLRVQFVVSAHGIAPEFAYSASADYHMGIAEGIRGRDPEKARGAVMAMLTRNRGIAEKVAAPGGPL
ncbi:DNA-binding FadR family transcriptional regulator [Inquilinus ginsengisoli]|uniref:DNA-binding FadR family transcriptional regulator n=1 Tax=Inquilinus ginsengisoli TaxID=363840 RepID=A0ABU1JNU9_9PROT|nr:FCD domain-containing protein [Inquilinus ginsengisoli]MDR6289219.1 DNA-binding FadR family transcriptional regulator [Inquilinus ginsengisoli]